jgi:2,3-diketo-5-methylthio-1-phosphopentane phosphatase
MSEIQVAVFCDFDGTVANYDVGYRLFHRFSSGRNEALIPDWKSGKLSSRDCLLQEAAMVRTSKSELYSFLDTIPLNPGFVEFDKLCRQNHTPLVILSDGLDLYIQYILRKYRLSHIPVHSNIGRLENDRITVQFPYPLGACGRCGNCKGERIAEYRKNQSGEHHIVFVGDGLSDTCAIGEADTLFAKKDLARYCAAKNIRYNSYKTFFDVARVLMEKGCLSNQPLTIKREKKP